MKVVADGGLELLDDAGLVVVPGWRGFHAPVPARLIEALRRAGERGCRFLSICSGVVVLAEAGLLDGRRATTHWRYADDLASRFPALTVEPDVLYVHDGNIVTSAGSAAGIDACLHVVNCDFGADATNRVARRLVVPPHRDGGQAQFIERPVARDHERASLGRLFDWIRARLHENLTIERLAGQAHMSQRTFLRRFREATGSGPGDWLVRERLALARALLETDGSSMDVVAQRCGFGSAATMRHHFRTRLGTTPTAYRATFRRVG